MTKGRAPSEQIVVKGNKLPHSTKQVEGAWCFGKNGVLKGEKKKQR